MAPASCRSPRRRAAIGLTGGPSRLAIYSRHYASALGNHHHSPRGRRLGRRNYSRNQCSLHRIFLVSGDCHWPLVGARRGSKRFRLQLGRSTPQVLRVVSRHRHDCTALRASLDKRPARLLSERADRQTAPGLVSAELTHLTATPVKLGNAKLRLTAEHSGAYALRPGLPRR
jgi:hypothetical protein